MICLSKKLVSYLRRPLPLLGLLLLSAGLPAQYLQGVQTRWNDSFKEWVIYTDDPQVQGSFELIWAMTNDWREWRFSLGDFSGTIKQKLSNNPNVWEIRSGAEVVTMRTVFANDFTSWRLTDNRRQYTFGTRFRNQLQEWELKNDPDNQFYLRTEWEGDPTTWIIEDRMAPGADLLALIGMTFLTIYHSTPKF